jgi:hypothetical protein
MANVAFTISAAPGVTNDLIAVIYKTTAPAAEVDRILKEAPHPDPYNFEFTDLEPGVYIVKIHESPDGSTLGNLRHDFWVDASLEKLHAYTIKEFQVGLGRGEPYYDPAHDSSAYENPDLKGLTYTVFKPGYGPLSWDANITDDPDGGFSFTDGQKFFQDEIYTIQISNLVTQPVTTTGGTSFIDGVKLESANVNLSVDHYRKMILVNTNTDMTITITDLDSIPDNMTFGINTHSLTDNPDAPTFRYCTLQLPGGKSCIINTFSRNAAYIARAEEVIFMKNGNNLFILSWDGDHRRVGETVFTDGLPPINSLPLVGGWYSKTQYPRIFQWYVNRQPLTELGTGTDDIEPDSTNRKKWIIGVNKFWVKDHKDMTYKVAGSGRLANSYQADSVGPANIRTTAWTGAGIGKNGVSSTSVGFLATMGDGGTINSDSASGTNNNAARTIEWSIISPAGESRVKNVATNAYVII